MGLQFPKAVVPIVSRFVRSRFLKRYRQSGGKTGATGKINSVRQEGYYLRSDCLNVVSPTSVAGVGIRSTLRSCPRCGHTRRLSVSSWQADSRNYRRRICAYISPHRCLGCERPDLFRSDHEAGAGWQHHDQHFYPRSGANWILFGVGREPACPDIASGDTVSWDTTSIDNLKPLSVAPNKDNRFKMLTLTRC